MSVEKIDFSLIRQEKKNFTTNLNQVLQGLRCAIALGLWVYLTSLPEGWVVNKEHLRRHFNIGRDKLDSTLLYLKQNGLIEIGQERHTDGKMGKGYIYVRCGYDFTKDCNINEQNNPQNEPFTEKPFTAQPDTAKPGHGKSAPINNINNINKDKSRERALSNCSNEEQKATGIETRPLVNQSNVVPIVQVSLPDDFEPSQSHFDLFHQFSFTRSEALSCFEKFKIYSKRKKSPDWNEEFKIWILREFDYLRRKSK